MAEEEEREDGKENADDLVPEDSRGVGEGAQEGRAGLTGSLAKAASSSRVTGADCGGRWNGWRPRRCGGRLSGPVAQRPRCDARADSEDPTETIRLHRKSLAAGGEELPDSDCPQATSEDKVVEVMGLRLMPEGRENEVSH